MSVRGYAACYFRASIRAKSPLIASKLSSDVRRERSWQDAVAAIKRSAGSWCERVICRLISAIAFDTGRSVSGKVFNAFSIQASGVGRSTKRPLSPKSNTSQIEIEERKSSCFPLSINFIDFVPSLSDPEINHTQAFVSNSNRINAILGAPTLQSAMVGKDRLLSLYHL